VKEHTPDPQANQPQKEFQSALEEVLREGARTMLRTAVEAEVAEYVNQHAELVDEGGRRLVVRNGHLPERELLTGIGPLKIRQPRVHDRRPGEKFTSKILPPFMRRVPSIDALIPCLYLKGISTGDFAEALEAILGSQAKGLSATNIVRLKEVWRQDYEGWRQRDLNGKHYVYVWVNKWF
jgi:transposase-like protein